jgi:hypothetical protein
MKPQLYLGHVEAIPQQPRLGTVEKSHESNSPGSNAHAARITNMLQAVELEHC